MPKIHHFVHLGYSTENHTNYQNKVLDRIEDIGTKIKKGAGDILVMVKDGERVDESLTDLNAYAMIELIASAIMYYNAQLRNENKNIIQRLYSFHTSVILDDVFLELSKHKQVLKSKHVFYVHPQKRMFHGYDNEKVLNTIVKEYIYEKGKGEKEFIDDYVMKIYFQIFQKIFRKYRSKNHFEINCGLKRNNEFRNKVSQILCNIPSHHVFYNEMRGYDIPGEIFTLNVNIQEHDYMFGEYYIKMKNFIGSHILDEYKKRLKKDFKKLEKDVTGRGFDFNKRDHIIGGEYTDCCVANYNGFLQYILNLKQEKIEIDESISLHSNRKKSK